MSVYLTVDGGTTNTRIYLVCEQKITYTVKIPFGVRDGKEKIKPALASAIAEILEKNSLAESDVRAVIASGMITSELGLCTLGHLHAPAGVSELHRGMHKELYTDVCSIPWTFIRGVKCCTDSLEFADMMRGEETELMGILRDGEALYILPGSHSKHISVDASGRICGFKTMLSGELFSALVSSTILKNSVDFEHCALERDELLRGFRFCEEHGINETLFKTRILGNIFGATKEACYSFLLGAVLKDEARSALEAKEKTVVLGGQKQLREALGVLLEEFGDKKIIYLSDSDVEASTALGAVRVFEYEE